MASKLYFSKATFRKKRGKSPATMTIYHYSSHGQLPMLYATIADVENGDVMLFFAKDEQYCTQESGATSIYFSAEYLDRAKTWFQKNSQTNITLPTQRT
jgi:hypothetical protein